MRDIWQATQADRALQKLDEEDGAYLAGLLDEALRRIAPNAPSPALASFSQLVMTLIAAAVATRSRWTPKQACAHADAVQANAAEEPGRTGDMTARRVELSDSP